MCCRQAVEEVHGVLTEKYARATNKRDLVNTLVSHLKKILVISKFSPYWPSVQKIKICWLETWLDKPVDCPVASWIHPALTA